MITHNKWLMRLEGYCDKHGNVGVNLTRLGKQCFDEEKFVQIFTSTFLHETLHNLIYDFYCPTLEYHKFGEEVVIRKMLDEEFPDYEREEYLIEAYNKRKQHAKL